MRCPKCTRGECHAIDGHMYECSSRVIVDLALNQPFAPAGIPIYGPCRHRFTAAEAQAAEQIREQRARERLEEQRRQIEQLERRAAEAERRRREAQLHEAIVDTRLPALERPPRPIRKRPRMILVLNIVLVQCAFWLAVTARSLILVAPVAALAALTIVQPVSRTRHAAALRRYERMTRAADERDAERERLHASLVKQ